MTLDEDTTAQLTRSIAATRGVRRVYPRHALSTAGDIPVLSQRNSDEGVVQLERDGNVLVITARLATDVDIPSAQVVMNVQATAVQVLGPTPFRLRLEIAHLTEAADTHS